MAIILQDAGDVLVKTFFPLRLNHSFPVFYSKNAMNVQLGIGVRHNDKGIFKANIKKQICKG